MSVEINLGSKYYKQGDNKDCIELEQVIFLGKNGIFGTEDDACLDEDLIGIKLKMEIPKKMFEFPTITVKIPEEYTRDDKVLTTVEEIEIPIKVEKEGEEISLDTKIASKERGFISLVMKTISEAFDPDK